jgi:hypothetical protein
MNTTSAAAASMADAAQAEPDQRAGGEIGPTADGRTTGARRWLAVRPEC